MEIKKFFNTETGKIIISILLIYKLSVNSYSTTVLFISISSIVCYFINIIVYNYIRYWIGTKSNSDPVYRKPFINIKCNCKKKENVSFLSIPNC